MSLQYWYMLPVAVLVATIPAALVSCSFSLLP